MPAIAEEADAWRREGEPLWPERFPLETLGRIREAIGGAAWQALYQQRPSAAEGTIFKREWWRTYRDQPRCSRVVFSMDTAFKAGEANDYSVVAIIGQTETGYHLLHLWRARAEFPELKRQAIALAEIWKPHAVLIEDAASGQSLIQSLKAETRLPVLPVKPLGDKQSRAAAVTPLIESGRVYLPETAPWLADFIDELSSFPAAPHDDMVDAFAQALNYMRGTGVVPGQAAREIEQMLRFSREYNRGRPQAGEMRMRCALDDMLDDAPGDGGWLDGDHSFGTTAGRWSRYRGTF